MLLRMQRRYDAQMPDERPDDDITRLLRDLDARERGDMLLPRVYEQLRAIAARRMAQERTGHTLQATALVHEAYAKLIGDRKVPWQNRAHFYVAAAEAMRQILLDHARSKNRLKRGGGAKRQIINFLDLADDENTELALALDEALQRLQAENPEAALIVRLRFYAGMSLDLVAEVLQMPARTLDRRWEYARAWLARAMEEDAGRSDPRSDA
jgi:RNA polymerase sigma factor (TIGR02999 family)